MSLCGCGSSLAKCGRACCSRLRRPFFGGLASWPLRGPPKTDSALPPCGRGRRGQRSRPEARRWQTTFTLVAGVSTPSPVETRSLPNRSARAPDVRGARRVARGAWRAACGALCCTATQSAVPRHSGNAYTCLSHLPCALAMPGPMPPASATPMDDRQPRRRLMRKQEPPPEWRVGLTVAGDGALAAQGSPRLMRQRVRCLRNKVPLRITPAPAASPPPGDAMLAPPRRAPARTERNKVPSARTSSGLGWQHCTVGVRGTSVR